jgi:hypothetical protein
MAHRLEAQGEAILPRRPLRQEALIGGAAADGHDVDLPRIVKIAAQAPLIAAVDRPSAGAIERAHVGAVLDVADDAQPRVVPAAKPYAKTQLDRDHAGNKHEQIDKSNFRKPTQGSHSRWLHCGRLASAGHCGPLGVEPISASSFWIALN